MSTIAVEQRPHAELHYFVLSHLNLRGDAANLYWRTRRWRLWARKLRRAYQRAPGRLLLQILPLLVCDLEEELRFLHDPPWRPLQDAPGRQLCTTFADIVSFEIERRPPVEVPSPPEPSFLPLLARCRSAIWSRADQDAPPLRIVHCPSLGCNRWTHARATTRARERVVALSLDVAEEVAFIQALHEEVHPVSDRRLADIDPQERSTEVSTLGFALHRQLEDEALRLGEEILRECAPEFLDIYALWRARYRM